MQNEAKSLRKEKKALGYKHEWTDTGGHSHRIVFDKKTLERPRTTWIALVGVFVLTFLIGGWLILKSPSSKDPVRFSPTRADSLSSKFLPKATLSDFGTQKPTAVAVGWRDEFFLADRSGVGLYDFNGKRLNFWKSAEETDDPVALCFIDDEKSAKNGVLLIAYPQKIDALAFMFDRSADENLKIAENVGNAEDEKDGDSKRNGEDGESAETLTAANGATEPATILSIPDAKIGGVAASRDCLFVADRKSERILRYSWLALDVLKVAEKKETQPDLTFGSADEELDYPGLRPTASPSFSIAYSASSNETLVANSGLFRVDAFDAETGAWKPTHSWAKPPQAGNVHVFSGAANPVAVLVSPNGWVATAEKVKNEDVVGKKSPLQLFNADGGWIAEIPQFAKTDKKNDETILAIASSSDFFIILALKSNGEVDVYENQ